MLFCSAVSLLDSNPGNNTVFIFGIPMFLCNADATEYETYETYFVFCLGFLKQFKSPALSETWLHIQEH